MNRLTAIGLASLVAYGVLLVAKWDGSGASPEAAPAAKSAADAGDIAVASGSLASGANLVQAMPARPLSAMRCRFRGPGRSPCPHRPSPPISAPPAT